MRQLVKQELVRLMLWVMSVKSDAAKLATRQNGHTLLYIHIQHLKRWVVTTYSKCFFYPFAVYMGLRQSWLVWLSQIIAAEAFLIAVVSHLKQTPVNWYCYVRVCVRVYMQVCCVWMCVSVWAWASVYVWVCVCVCTWVCMCLSACACTCVRGCVRGEYVLECVCMCVYVCVYVCKRRLF